MLNLILLFIVSCSALKANEQDRFENFAELESHSKQDVDYQVHIENRNSKKLIMAIHGGKIESGTQELAQEIAAESLSYYIFEGISAPEYNSVLLMSSYMHLTSHHFDDPVLVNLAKSSEDCLSIHGYDGEIDFCLGGANENKRAQYLATLKKELKDFTSCELCCPPYNGLAAKNVVNLCTLQGVQIEMSPKLRKKIIEDLKFRKKLAKILR